MIGNGEDPAKGGDVDDRRKNLLTIGGLAAVYFLAGKLGLSMAFVHPSSTAVWPPTGIALAAFLILGTRVWPGVFLGAFLVNVTTAGTILTSLGVATGNTLEGLVGAYLVTRFANGRYAFDRGPDTFKFAILAGTVGTAVAATFGVTSLSLGGFAHWADFKDIWLTWWLGDGVGAVIVAPLLILWISDFRMRWRWTQIGEMLALIMGMLLIAEIVFCGVLFRAPRNYPLEYLCIPFLIWAALRFGRREAASVTVLLSGVAVWGTLHGFGPFAIGTKNESLLLLQAFMGIVAVMTMALAALAAERRRAEEQIRSLAVTDPLTGLANYRRLVDVLDAEIRRFGRTGRTFAVLLLDLDGLKRINDQHGHLAGSRALCRLADILRVHCRDIDTAARYGGDEFALVIPEAGPTEAMHVVQRIRERVAQDGEAPPISVSVGAAVYPLDGDTRDALLGAADHALYEMKQRSRRDAHASTTSEASQTNFPK
jgi:diguanylate cyclase (GGDEF)-like protein